MYLMKDMAEQLDRIEAKLDKLLERKKPKQSLLTEWIVPPYINQDIWNQYVKMRKEKKNSITESIYIAALKKFDKWHKNGIDTNKVLLKSVENGWIGLFTDGEQSEVSTATHDQVDFKKLRDAEKSLDPVDPYASLKS